MTALVPAVHTILIRHGEKTRKYVSKSLVNY